MNKQKWAREKSKAKLLFKFGEEVGEVFKSALEPNDYREHMVMELDHAIFIAERLKKVLDV